MIYDCFIFWKEFDVLEIRLHELADTVHRFVLVEATTTFSGLPKPLHFAEQRARFGEFAERITHVVVDDLAVQPDPWARERYQRNCILRGLPDCRPGDVILISDVDEIPPARSVTQQKSYQGVTVFFPRLYYYFLNCQASTTNRGTCMLPFDLMVQAGLSPDAVRMADIGEIPYQVERDGGWHFSYCGGPREIQEKIEAYSHQEYNSPEYTDVRHILQCMAGARDLFGRDEMTFRAVPVDSSFPRYLYENRARFASLIRPV